MPVKIRLSRIGKKHVPFYRVVVADARAKRDGEYLADIGTYDAIKGKVVTFDTPLYDAWVSKGAQPTDSAKKIYKLFKKSEKTVAAPVAQKPVRGSKKAEAAPVDAVTHDTAA